MASRINFMTAGLIGIIVMLWWLAAPRRMPEKANEIKKPAIYTSQSKCLPAESQNDGYTLPIVLYHYIEYIADKSDTHRVKSNIIPDIFEAQLRKALFKDYKTVFVKEIPFILDSPERFCYKYVSLTFDDGYEDFYKYVYPLLRKYNAKATVYVITEYINKKGFLTETQIAEMLNSNLIEIGSHSITHPDLKEETYTVSLKEITDSKRDLEAKFGIYATTFSYPFGHYNAGHIEMVRQASYSAALTVQRGTMHTKESLMELSRIRPSEFEDLLNASFPL